MDQEFRATYRPSKAGEQSADVEFLVRYDQTEGSQLATVTHQFVAHGMPNTK